MTELTVVTYAHSLPQMKLAHLREWSVINYHSLMALLTSRLATTEQRQELRRRLKALQHSFLDHGRLILLYCGPELASRLSDKTIECIVCTCETLHTIDDLEESCLVWDHADEIMCIIDSVFED